MSGLSDSGILVPQAIWRRYPIICNVAVRTIELGDLVHFGQNKCSSFVCRCVDQMSEP
jgi:hypothetical protein